MDTGVHVHGTVMSMVMDTENLKTHGTVMDMDTNFLENRGMDMVTSCNRCPQNSDSIYDRIILVVVLGAK